MAANPREHRAAMGRRFRPSWRTMTISLVNVGQRGRSLSMKNGRSASRDPAVSCMINRHVEASPYLRLHGRVTGNPSSENTMISSPVIVLIS
jgi:hypothetical protein